MTPERCLPNAADEEWYSPKRPCGTQQLFNLYTEVSNFFNCDTPRHQVLATLSQDDHLHSSSFSAVAALCEVSSFEMWSHNACLSFDNCITSVTSSQRERVCRSAGPSNTTPVPSSWAPASPVCVDTLAVDLDLSRPHNTTQTHHTHVCAHTHAHTHRKEGSRLN